MINAYSEIIDTDLGKFIILNTDTNQGLYYKNNNKHIEQNHIDLLNSLLKKINNPVVLDIGANLGFFTFGMVNNIDNATVYSFEPQRILSNMIGGSIALNCKENMYVRNAAVGSFNGKIKIPKYDYSIISSFGSVSTEEVKNREYIGQNTKDYEYVDILTIDSLMLDKVDLIKIDVEGMELSVLEGALNTITKYKPILFVEFLKSNTTSLYNTLLSFGYDIDKVDDNFLCIPVKG